METETGRKIPVIPRSEILNEINEPQAPQNNHRRSSITAGSKGVRSVSSNSKQFDQPKALIKSKKLVNLYNPDIFGNARVMNLIMINGLGNFASCYFSEKIVSVLLFFA